jgi:hypothetical protein
METPSKRILTLTTAPFPKAEVQVVDPRNGVLLFAWLDADGNRVDSGNSIARFVAVQLPPVEPETVGEYAEPSDETLVAAIQA